MQGIIKQLDSLTASQIAAGEVVERPVSVVKELIENSIDAAASHIEVRLSANDELSQIGEIWVIDNGRGILAVDLPQAFGRHATSKLSCAADLDAVLTLGFRGEALPSIAAVSRVEICSCTPNDNCAWQVQAAEGEISQPQEAALAKGTRVIVRDLFYNTPARKKFLKSYATETGAISKLVGDFILARPDIAFSLQIDGRQVLRSAGGGDPTKAVLAVYGSQVLADLKTVSLPGDRISVSGFASMPPFARSSRRYYHFFVNGRLIKSPELNGIVDDAYRSMMPEKRYPLVILHLQVPPKSIDVNVHPAKTEIRFKRLAEIHDAVLPALRQALLPTVNASNNLNANKPTANNPPAAIKPDTKPNDNIDFLRDFMSNANDNANFNNPATANRPAKPARRAAEPSLSLGGLDLQPTPKAEQAAPNFKEMSGPELTNLLSKQQNDEPDFAARLFQNLMANAPGAKIDYKRDDGEWLAENFGVTYLDNPVEQSAQPSLFGNPAADNLFLALKPLGQLNNSYIIAALGEDLYIIDQHAAHERILYEEFALAYALDCRESSQLAAPVTIDVGDLQTELLLNNINRLADCGFVLEHFGGSSFVIRAVPLWYVRGAESGHQRKSNIYDNDIKGFFLDVFELMLASADEQTLDIAALSQQELFTTACKSAIKAKEHLNGQEISWLLHNLAECDQPQTCPHGRPTFFKITDAEIRRRFMRSAL